ncbi:hypothetical protein BASA60_004206 [Batrachochytrium salamandrivorans]|nr:hypothetical protein BASA60_004206 [Batrachochytrium salamandrivorans]
MHFAYTLIAAVLCPALSSVVADPVTYDNVVEIVDDDVFDDDTYGQPRRAAIVRPYYDDAVPSDNTISHWMDPDLGQDSLVMAGMRINASVPSVNLDNIPGMRAVICDETSVSLALASLYTPRKWAEEATLLVISSYHKCGPQGKEEFTMRLAISWGIDPVKKVVIFQTVDPQKNGVTGSYEVIAMPKIIVSSAGLERTPPPIPSNMNYTRMPTFNEPSSMHQRRDLIFYKEVAPPLEKRGFPMIDHSVNVPLGINIRLDKTFSMAIPSTTGSVSLGCQPCGIQGSSTATFRGFGKLFHAPSFSVNWGRQCRSICHDSV